MMATLQQQLITAEFYGLFYLLFICFNIRDIRFCMSGYAIEVAKLTIGDTHIGRIHVAVYLPGYLSVRYLFLAKFIGYIHQISECSVFKQKQAFFYREKL